MQRKSRTHHLFHSLIESLESRRLLSGGGLDTSFNGNGKDSIIFDNATVTGRAMAVQSDGKIVEVGKTNGTSYSVVRYNANGSEDNTFGPNHNGKITAHMQTSAFVDTADAVAIQSNGDIVVAGEVSNPFFIDDVGNNSNHVFIVRYTSSGALDMSFGKGGIVLLNDFDSGSDFQDAAYGLAIQKDGKIVMAGYESQGLINYNDNVVIARLNTNGSLDTSFNGDGKANIDLGDNEVADAVAIDYNGTLATNSDYGKIVVVGHQTTNGFDGQQVDIDIYHDADPATTYKILVARFNTNGTPDTSFNGNGVLVTKAGYSAASIDARAVTIEVGGKIVIAGSEGTNIGSTNHNFFLARINVNGTLDKTFGTNGSTVSNLGGDDIGTSLVVGGLGGQLIAGGTASGKFALAAYSLDGHPYGTFGTSGQVTTKVDNTATNVQLALSPNHTIVAAGGLGFNTARYFDIAPVVSITSPDDAATEGETIKHVGKKILHITDPATMIVSRDESLPFATRVYFTVGGTANIPNASNNKRGIADYTLSGMSVTNTSITTKTAFVDIPAGLTSVTVTFNAVDDAILEPTETASFAIQTNANYAVGTPATQVMSIIDNDSKTLAAAADAYVKDGSSANTNFGTVTQLAVKKSSTSGNNRQAYLKFDLSSLTTADTVKLNLFGALNNSDNTNLMTQLFSVADNSWTENGINFNNKPPASSIAIASATILNTTQQTYTFDVTAYVKAQLAAGHKIVSFVVKNPSNSSAAFIFNSREAGSNKPTLAVT